MKTTKLFALVLALFLLALPLTSCNLGADGDLAARLDSMEALISQQNATIEGLNVKLSEQSSTIAGQNTIINGLNTQLFEQNTAIGNLNTKLTEQNTIIAGQNSTIEDLNTQISEQGSTISNQNATIEGLNNTVTEQGSTIESLNTQISEQSSTIAGQNATIDNLNNTVTTQGTTIEGLNSQVSKQNSTIENLNAQVSEQDSTINDLNTKLSAQDSVISDLESQVSNLEESKPQTKTVILSNDNYLSYLSFNVTFGELQRIEEIDETLGSIVRYVCKMTVTTRAARPGLSFKISKITYSFDASNMLTISDTVWKSVGTKWCDQKVDISADGYSEATFYIWCSPVHSFTVDEEYHFYQTVPPLPNTFSNIPIEYILGIVTIKE